MFIYALANLFLREHTQHVKKVLSSFYKERSKMYGLSSDSIILNIYVLPAGSIRFQNLHKLPKDIYGQIKLYRRLTSNVY